MAYIEQVTRESSFVNEDSRSFENEAFTGSLPDPLLQERGWLLSELLDVDAKLSGRWDYLTACWYEGKLVEHPIPRIHFEAAPNQSVLKMLGASLDSIPNRGRNSWTGWSSSEYLRYFLEWLLHGLGHQGHQGKPKEPYGCEGAADRVKSAFDLALLLAHPHDYFGEMFCENAYGKRQGFFPTPHNICEMMALMTIGVSGHDTRAMSVMDPCVGTGRMLLHASNYSMRLYGQEIDPVLCLTTLANGYFFAPWLVKPLPFLDEVQYRADRSGEVSDSMVDQAPSHFSAALFDTVHDSENQWQFEPIKKRRRRTTGKDASGQESLF